MSAVQICNKGLIHVGNSPTIAALDEGSAEAKLCNQVYDENRQELLRNHPWGFATSEVILATTGETPANNWTYEYQYPNDCLAFLNIENTASRILEPPPHRKGRNANGDTVVWTDENLAVGRYVVDVTNPNNFDVGFKRILSMLIGIDICMPLTGDRQLRADLVQMAEVAFMQAANADLQETQYEDLPDPDFIRARG